MKETHSKNNKTPTAYVDIDDTICFYENGYIYEDAIPSHKNIAKINKMYDEGWTIVYWTARGSTQPENGERVEALRKLTIEQLERWNAKFHTLVMGDKKPLFDIVIDDKAKRIEEL
jgi:hypothetical protein